MLRFTLIGLMMECLNRHQEKLQKGLKKKLKKTASLFFLATEGTISSKWCNWELGFGDSHKYIDNIAIFPIRNDYDNFSGTQYLDIYPRIEFVEANTVTRKVGGYFSAGYYVITPRDEDGTSYYTRIEEWLER